MTHLGHGMDEITNTADIIDSREVIARIEYLRAEIAADEISEENGAEPNHRGNNGEHKPDPATCGTCGKTWDDGLISGRTPAPSARCPYEGLHEEIRELAALEALQDEAEGYAGDWRHGEALIRESYFEEYAEDFADNIGAIDRNATWPICHIDWKAAADSLKQDYTSVDFDGVTYWVRS